MSSILIIEDTRENLHLYDSIISMVEKELNFSLNHQFASTFEQAQAALEEGLIKPERSPSLILLDMEIPYKGHQDSTAGYQIMERYRKQFPDTYWVPLTAVLAWHEKE